MILCACQAGSGQKQDVLDSPSVQELGNKPGKVGEIASPEGFERKELDSSSFAWYLRNFALSENDTVYFHNGEVKWNQNLHHKVLDIDVGTRDLQQCADAVIRLRAEYLWNQNRKNEIGFHFTSGHLIKWSDYAKGIRPKINGSQVRLVQTSAPDASRANFRKYLDLLFTYCGTYSLHKELKQVLTEDSIQIGDVFIQTGNPYGHAVIVIDVAHSPEGKKAYMLAQSYMPAQSIHILLDPAQNYKSPWFITDDKAERNTPSWLFYKSDLRRFP